MSMGKLSILPSVEDVFELSKQSYLKTKTNVHRFCASFVCEFVAEKCVTIDLEPKA